MSQHISHHDLEKYLDRRLLPDELVAFDAHLAGCEMCFEKTADLRSGQAATISLHDTPAADVGRDEHLSYAQLAGYVDDQLGEVDKEIVDVHKRVCDDCAEQIGALFQLRATLELENEPAKALKASTGRLSFTNLPSRIADGSFLRFAVPAFAVLLVGILIWSVWFMTKNSPNDMAEVVGPADEKPDVEMITETSDANSLNIGPSDANLNLPLAGISLADGGARISLDSDGNLRGLNAPQFESRVKSAMTTQDVQISTAARELRSRSGVLMGDGQPGAPFALTAPVGKIVESDQPQFRWRPLDGAESYVVTIYDANFNKIVASPALRQPVWKVGTRLKRGIVYQWQVSAIKGGQEIKSPVRPAPDARFKILDAVAANDIDTAKRTNGNSHLLLGILYANAGLINEAEREFQALLNKNPKSDVAKRLLNKVRAAR